MEKNRKKTIDYGKKIRRLKPPVVVVVATVVTLLVAAACGGGKGNGSTADTLAGKVAVSGSSTVEPITSLVAEKFSSAHPNVSVSVDGPGTGDGFKLFCQGETDIADASRPIKDEEKAACAAGGVQYSELKVGYDGISVLSSSKDKSVKCLGLKDLYALVGPESNGFTKWSDAQGLATEIGATHTPYPNEPMVIVAPGPESGTFDAFIEMAIAPTAKERGQAAKVRTTQYTSSANDNVIIEGLAGKESSLGWAGYAYAEQNKDRVKEIAIDAGTGKGCVAPNPKTIATGTYALSRALYIYVDKAKVTSNPAVRALVDFYLSKAGLSSVTEAGYVSLSDADLNQSHQTWASAL